MAKYDPLRDHLARRRRVPLRMTFDQVADLVGPLPQSAFVHRAWWANDTKVQSIAWRSAGWRVDAVDQTAREVLFAPAEPGDRPPSAAGPGSGPAAAPRRQEYVRAEVIDGFARRTDFDYGKLLRLLQELNDNHRRGNAYACHALLRAVLDHIPPLLGQRDFNGVVNNRGWGRTDAAYLRRLKDFRAQADDVLHRQISRRADGLDLDDLPARACLDSLLRACLE